MKNKVIGWLLFKDERYRIRGYIFDR
jgi:hypothetical protein